MKKILLFAAAALLFISAAAQDRNRDWADYGRYAEANAALQVRPRAVFMGDSITDLWYNQDAAFFDDNNFAGRGISGQVSAQMLARFRRDVLELKPKYVVILAGTNDIALNNGKISLENVLGNIVSMCELAKAHKIKPVLCSVLPAAEFKWRPGVEPAEDIIRLNEMIREYARKAGIPYVDYHSALKDGRNGLPEKYSKDEVHPTLEAYKLMEELVLKAVRK